MRIAIAIFKYFPFGGLQKDMMLIARRALERGHSVEIFTSFWNSPFPENMPVRILPARGWMNHTRAVRFEHDFHKAADSGNFDVKLTFNRIGGCDFYFAGDACLSKTWEEKPPIFRWFPRIRTFLDLEKRIFSRKSKTKIFYISPSQKIDYQFVYGTPENRFCELPPGLDFVYRDYVFPLEKRAAKRASFGVNPDEILLLLAAANPMLKGFDRLLKAVSSLPEDWKKKIRIFVAGPDPAARGKRLAEKNCLGDRVIFGGIRSDMPEIYASADLTVHPARAEAAGNVLLESIVCGTPVLCSGICGFAPYVARSGGVVLSRPFRQRELDDFLFLSLENLAALTDKVRRNPENKTFFRRADACIDGIENWTESRKK